MFQTSEAASTATATPVLDTQPVLEVSNLETSFFIGGKQLKAVDNVSFSVGRGRTLGIVGESGCGKSVTSLSVMRLIPWPPGKITAGTINLEGKDLLKLSEDEMRKYRGNKISMIFQEPMTSLNPVFTVGDQVGEVYRVHKGANKREARDRAIEMLRQVRIPSPEQRVDEFPHQLSGGMRQRVMIAMALACRPGLLIADEPTTALDVTIQAQILALMNNLQAEVGMSVVLITHDLGVVAETCDDVVVMYAGKIVERASTKELFTNPKHPYTRGLMESIPKLGAHQSRLKTIPGLVPGLGNLPNGCRFQDRCPLASDECRAADPALRDVGGKHEVACIKAN